MARDYFVSNKKKSEKYGNPVVLPLEYNDEISHEERIAQLETKNAQLEEKIAQLEESNSEDFDEDGDAVIVRNGGVRILTFNGYTVTKTLIGKADEADYPNALVVGIGTIVTDDSVDSVLLKAETDGEIYVTDTDGLAIAEGTLYGEITWIV